MKKVYIVEDELLISLALKMSINKMKGYSVIGHANSENKAYNDILVLKPDIVISDVRLLEGNGIDLIKRIRQIKECDNIKFLIVSGQYFDDDETKTLNMLKNIFFASKPIHSISRKLESIEDNSM